MISPVCRRPGCLLIKLLVIGGVLVAELGGEFAAGIDAEFGVDVGEVELHSFDADEEFAGDLPIALAGSDESGDR